MSHTRGAAEDEAPLDHEQHKQHRRLVGKIQRHNQTSAVEQRNWQHSLTTRSSRSGTLRAQGACDNLRAKIQTQDKRVPLNIDTDTDANMRQEEHTRICDTLSWSISTLRKQNTSNTSTAESELYAINTAAQESLHISNFIKEAFEVRTNIGIHTNSSAASSIAVRYITESKAHRAATALHTTTCQEQINHNAQSKIRGQSSRLPNKACQLRYPQQTHVQRWPVRPSQQFHTSNYSSQHSLLNKRRAGQFPFTAHARAIQLSFRYIAMVFSA